MRKLAVATVVLIAMVGCSDSPKHTRQGVVTSVNLRNSWTELALLPDGGMTPESITLCERHPEIWQRQHIRLVFQYGGGKGYCFDTLEYERIGPDK